MSQNDKPNPTSPPTFQDSQGQTWTIKPSMGLFDEIQAATGLDLIPDDRDVTAVMSLPLSRKKLTDVLWSSIASQAKLREIERKDFRESIDGDVLSAGWGALLDAVVFFTPIQFRAEMQSKIELFAATMEKESLALVETMQSRETDEAVTKAAKEIQSEMQANLPKELAKFALSSQE